MVINVKALTSALGGKTPSFDKYGNLTNSISSSAVSAVKAAGASISTAAKKTSSSSTGSVPITAGMAIITGAVAGGSKMGSGSTYDQIDTILGGMLPGGVSPTSVGTSTALKLAGASAGVAAAYGAYTAADKYLFGGKLPLGAAKTSTRKKIRHYNYTNMKALKRADKRIDGFIKLSRKVVSSVGYTIKRKGAN